jgi:2-amino-4-hydroxy-6-hydroxymethyldihydropteridine diphosphokinase
MVDVFIGLGSNLGDRKSNLMRAMEILEQRMKLLKVSSLYESEPVYKKDQPWFVNCVAKFGTILAPKELLEYLHDVEKKLGRERNVRYGPRCIDLDILFYGDEIVEDHDLKIPHPMIHERRFVLVPLAEIDPDYIHPTYRSSVAALLAKMNSNEIVRKLEQLE